MDWYALFVETNKEENVQQWLRFYFDESILRSVVPRRKLIERKGGIVREDIKVLFPGYILIRTAMTAMIYKEIKRIPHSIRMLGNGSFYSKIDEEEIAPILSLIGPGEIINFSKIYFENSKVIVKSGPLHGLEGIIYKIDARKNRAKILVNFMNAPKMVDVGIELLEAPL